LTSSGGLAIQKTVHRVRAGETAATIAKLYNISLPQLMKVNRLTGGDTITVGQTLIIPRG